MISPLSRTRSPIGLDIGASCIKAVQLVRARSGWRVAATASIPRAAPDPIPTDEEVGRIADTLLGAGFTGASVVVGAPRARLRSAVLDLPPRQSGAPIDLICIAEAARMFHLTPGSYEMHAWEIPTASDRATTTQFSVNALETAHAEILVTPLERAGLLVEAIDLPGEALGRAGAPAVPGGEGLTALLDVGWSGVQVVVIRQGEPIYDRWLHDRGIRRVCEPVAKALALDERSAQLLLRRIGLRELDTDNTDSIALARLRSLIREYAEQLLNQVLASVVYVLDRFPGEAVTRLRLTGGGAAVPELDAYLAELSGLDAARLTPSACSAGCSPQQDRPELVIALGHALWRAD